ncbi:MAG: hypothetical protein R3183_13070, partial [Oleiphilaceae bacterium]|nr:hypothetical protein [Oleiphilaceae bacterium]
YIEWQSQWAAFGSVAHQCKLLRLDKGREQHGLIFPKHKMNSIGDRMGCHAQLDRGNKEYVYNFIPEELIEFAYQQSRPFIEG